MKLNSEACRTAFPTINTDWDFRRLLSTEKPSEKPPCVEFWSAPIDTSTYNIGGVFAVLGAKSRGEAILLAIATQDEVTGEVDIAVKGRFIPSPSIPGRPENLTADQNQLQYWADFIKRCKLLGATHLSITANDLNSKWAYPDGRGFSLSSSARRPPPNLLGGG